MDIYTHATRAAARVTAAIMDNDFINDTVANLAGWVDADSVKIIVKQTIDLAPHILSHFAPELSGALSEGLRVIDEAMLGDLVDTIVDTWLILYRRLSRSPGRERAVRNKCSSILSANCWPRRGPRALRRLNWAPR